LVLPTDISELRRVLGLFQVSRECFEHPAHLAKALTELTRGRKPKFKWTSRHEHAFGAIRDKEPFSGVNLCPPRHGHSNFCAIAKTMPVVTAVVCFLSTQNVGSWIAARRKLGFF
jgi:hypothetical protein